MRSILVSGVLLMGLLPGSLHAAFALTRGHYYGSRSFVAELSEYDSAGTFLGSRSYPESVAREIRGIEFGSDGTLYAVADRGSGGGVHVLALSPTGAVTQTYSFTGGAISSNISYGKIVVRNNRIYVAAGAGIVRFDIGNPSSGTQVFNQQAIDLDILPNGNFLVAQSYGLLEVTPAGQIVRTMELAGPESFTDIRGVCFDPATNNLFVTHLGHTGFQFRLMRIDLATMALEANVNFTYADDLFLTDEGHLLVGSRTMAPRIYSQDLFQVSTLEQTQRMFVTQYVPEPTALLGIGSLSLGLVRRRQHG